MRTEHKNRWISTTQKEISIFKKTMFAVSAMVLLALILLYFFSGVFHFLYTEILINISSNNSEILDEADVLFTQELLMMSENIASMLISIFSFTLSCLFFIFVMNGKGREIDSYISLKPRFPKNTVVLIIFGLGIVYFFSYISTLFDTTLSFFGILKYESFFYSFPQTPTGVIIYFVSIVVTPAIFEEFAFRYLILNSLRKYGNVFAIVVSSVLFGFLHASTSAFFFATALGIFSAYMAVKTKSLWFSIVLHAVVNSASVLFEYLSGILSKDASYFVYSIYFHTVLAITLIATFIFIKKDKNMKLAEHKARIYVNKRTKIRSFWNIISVIFFIAVILISLGDYYFQYGDFI